MSKFKSHTIAKTFSKTGDANKPSLSGKSQVTPEKLDVAILQRQQMARENLESVKQRPKEIGGPDGLEPTRYGDWEVGGRCSDF